MPGVPDEEWIPKVGKNKGVVITQDKRIQTTRHQKELYMKYGVGIFFFSTPKKGLPYWESVKRIINKWEEIKSLSAKTEKPFAFRTTASNRRFEKV